MSLLYENHVCRFSPSSSKKEAMANYLVGSGTLPPEPSSKKKTSKDHPEDKAAPQHSVSFIYQTSISDTCRSVIVTWCQNTTDHSFCINVDNNPEDNKNTCKIDLKSRQSWGKKGLKSFEVEGKRVDIFWDFRQAKFSIGPQALSGYYVALVYKKELLLMLGDLVKEAYVRTKSKPSAEEATLLSKKEIVYEKKLFCTRAMLEEGKEEHDVVIETSLSGPDDPEMWIYIDGMVVTRIMNLNWRFRGNDTIIVNNLALQIFWDVHDWLFDNELSSSHGFFIFKPCSVESASNAELQVRDFPETSEDYNGHELLDESSSIQGFCHFLHAWRVK
ncbi:hypothetical protein L6164_030962 [Bauhinia variegata]|uniref:Uncharacterized protein n=1 Tax=Bauhinia variegata TaxID=167791 RepID=A0ACB9LEI2_BAUVA|nr:hypothetical protein L6164_030962 [Bauhinia variegata]